MARKEEDEIKIRNSDRMLPYDQCVCLDSCAFTWVVDKA